MTKSLDEIADLVKSNGVCDTDFAPPVFILSAPRSYSSFVCAMLGQNPKLYGVPELNLFQCRTMDEFITGMNADLTKKSPFWNVMRHGLLRAVAELYGGEQTVASVQMAERWVKTRRERRAGEVYKELCRKVAPLRIIDKSPGYVRKREFLDRLLESFPDAQFIHLVRHPRGQCESIMKTRGGTALLMSLNAIDDTGAEPILDPQILWHDIQIQILNFLDALPQKRWRTIRGEDFFNDADAVLQSTCRWLKASYSRKAIMAMKQPESSPYASVGPPNARLGNDINFLRSPHYRGATIEIPRLDGPLPWRPDGKGFYPEVIELAQELGYS